MEWAADPRWILRPPPPEDDARRLADALRLPLPLARVLVQRGRGEPEAAKRHLRPLIQDLPDPGRLRDLSAAADRIADAIRMGEPIFVHGDYDVDGVCAAALLTRWIRRLGGTAHGFAPHRLRDGYDLSLGGVERARASGAGLLVTVDCGIVAHEAVQAAVDAGLDVIVTDHHTPGDTLPSALAVVNPNRSDDDSGYGDLCGAAIAFALVRVLAERAGHDLEELVPDLDLVALATVSDLVPLRETNRALVRYGLRALGRTTKPGLRALLEVTGLAEPGADPGAAEPIEAGKVGFVLGPRINAVGRMGDAGDALALLLTEDREEATRLAGLLDRINLERQEEDQRTLAEALDLLEREYDPDRDYGVVLAGEGWHPGVIGIVASRVVERIHRPVILVALDGDQGRGSARSIPGFQLYDAIATCAPLLRRFGGHAQAAGLDVSRDQLDPLREGFRRAAAAVLEGQDLRPRLRADLELDPGEATLELADLSRWLGPHGIGNSRPVFLARDLEVVGTAREVGRGHLKLRLRGSGQPVDAIGFRLLDRIPLASVQGRMDALFRLSVNEWRGRRTAQLQLLDIRPSGGEVEVESQSPDSGAEGAAA